MPCATCPFRDKNWQEDRYPADHHEALWSGSWDPQRPASAMRNGALNVCHTSGRTSCAGAMALHHRELLRYLDNGPSRSLLTRLGVERVAARLLNENPDLLPASKRPDPVRVGPWTVTPAPKRVPLRLLRELDRVELLRAVHPRTTDQAVGSHCSPRLSRTEVNRWTVDE